MLGVAQWGRKPYLDHWGGDGNMAMTFDEYAHLFKIVMIKAGQEVRKARGLPEEKNVSKVYLEMCELVGIPPVVTKVSSMPRQTEGALVFTRPQVGKRSKAPQRSCPQCGMETFLLLGLCASCKDAEGGKYRSTWKCAQCGYQEKSPKAITTWLDELGIDFGSQSKKSLGIDIVTDEGVK